MSNLDDINQPKITTELGTFHPINQTKNIFLRNFSMI